MGPLALEGQAASAAPGCENELESLCRSPGKKSCDAEEEATRGAGLTMVSARAVVVNSLLFGWLSGSALGIATWCLAASVPPPRGGGTANVSSEEELSVFSFVAVTSIRPARAPSELFAGRGTGVTGFSRF